MTLVDIHGQPLRRQALKRELTPADGRGLRTIYTELQHSGVTPEYLTAILRESEDGDPRAYLELAERIEESDLHYLAVMGVRRGQVSQLPIRVVAADESAEAEADADLLRDWLKARELEDEIFDMLDAVSKGFSVAEIIWETSAREWMPVRLEHRLPQWFRFDQVSGMRLQRLEDAAEWVDLEPGKFVCHTHRAKSGIPIRGGLMRAVCWAWSFKAFGIRDWLRFIERFGHPLPLGKYGKGANPDDVATLWRAVRSVGVDGGAVFPESMELEIRENTGTGVRADLYKDLLSHFDAYISKVVLGQTLTTQEGGSGSYSLGQVHDSVRGDIERADAKQIAATLTNQLGRPMVLLNRGDPGARGYPRFIIGREEEIDPAVLADVLSKVQGLRVRAEQVRKILGLQDPAVDDEILTTGAGGPMPDREAAAAARLLRGTGRRDGGEDTAIDRAVSELIDGDGWRPLMDPVLAPVFREAAAARDRGESLEAFRDRLPTLFASMNDDRFVEALTNLAFSARISGQVGLGGDPDDLD